MLAMHVSNPGSHTLWRFPRASSTSSFSSQVRKEGLVRACCRRSVKVGLLKMLGFVLCCAVAIQSSLSLLQVKKEEVHDTHHALIVSGCYKSL